VQLAHDLGERVVDGDGDGDALAREFGTAAPTLVVRPHPTNPEPLKTFSHPGVVIHPNGGDQADSPESWQEYYDQLAHCVVCVRLEHDRVSRIGRCQSPVPAIVSEDTAGAGANWTFSPFAQGRIPRDLP
jgi:hypothetical protein